MGKSWEQPVEYSPYWAIHSQRENRPVLRDWARSEAEARQKMEALRTADAGSPEEEYWVTRLTKDQVVRMQQGNAMPTQL